MGDLPTMRTARLLLRPRTPDDLADCLAMDREPGITRWITGPWHDPHEHRAFVLDRMHRDHRDGLGYWTLERHDDPGRFLGWVLLVPEDATGPDVEIGWRLQTHAHGQGLATEAAREVLRHGLHDVGLARVVAEIDVANVASVNVASKLGMVAERGGEGPRGPTVRMVAAA